ncbi:MAG: Hpt domain-containing protein [Desulfarculaceae bacterium]
MPEKTVEKSAHVDFETLLAKFGGDGDMVRQLIKIFLEDMPGAVALIEQRLAAGDAGALQEAAHSFKGAVGNFEARPAWDLARELETLASEGRLDRADQAFNRLKAELEQLSRELGAF